MLLQQHEVNTEEGDAPRMLHVKAFLLIFERKSQYKSLEHSDSKVGLKINQIMMTSTHTVT